MSLLTIWHGAIPTGRFKKMKTAWHPIWGWTADQIGIQKSIHLFRVSGKRAKSPVMPVVGLNGTVGSAVKIFFRHAISANTVFSKSIER